MSDAFTDDDLRKAMFVPCATRADLHLWILVYLGLDIPDCLVDTESTATPLDVLWEMYALAMANEGEATVVDANGDEAEAEPKRLLAYGCRDGFKTLGAAIMEVLCIVHLGRSVAHMAAIESQAGKAQRYVKNFFAKRFLRDYVVTRNERRIEFVHHFNEKTGEHLTVSQWSDLPIQVQDDYRRLENYIQIIICTLQGTNSEHVPFMVVDEVDVVENPRAYEEAKFIPAPYEGKMPLTLLVSTRKTSFGLVQKEIDNAPKTGLDVRHWNIIDVTRACPASRHKPEEPRVTLYRSDEELRHVDEAGYEALDASERPKYVKQEGAYAGCAKCPIFSTCKGALATKQKSQSKLLKPIPHVIHQFKNSSLENAQAQLMCRKPSATGLVYPRFNREIHMLTAAEIAKRIVGETAPQFLDKHGLIAIMMQTGVTFFSGLDWGFSHNFAIISGAVWGLNIYIFDVISQNGLDPEEKLEVASRIKEWNPTIFADPEAPDQIKLFKKKGFQMREWKKTPGSVKMGIDVMRMKMRPAVGDPQFFILKDDIKCELLADYLSKYHFELDDQGEPTETPSEDHDDEPDACRYLVQNLFTPKGRITTSGDALDQPAPQVSIADINAPPTEANYLQHFINQHLGEGLVGGEPSAKRGKKGRLIWSMD